MKALKHIYTTVIPSEVEGSPDLAFIIYNFEFTDYQLLFTSYQYILPYFIKNNYKKVPYTESY